MIASKMVTLKDILNQAEIESLKNQTEEEKWLGISVAYTRFLRAKHPNWTTQKLKKKVASHLNLKFV